jgi:predicted enzyme related to lactoylglutathione lyase
MHIEIAIDCDDADRMAAFWIATLGYEFRGSFEQYRSIVDPTGEGPKILFQQLAPGERTTGKNSIHLDMHVTDVASEVARLTDLGATELHAVDLGETYWVTMSDVEGNQFCVCRHG